MAWNPGRASWLLARVHPLVFLELARFREGFGTALKGARGVLLAPYAPVRALEAACSLE